jgi:hypothetical protein
MLDRFALAEVRDDALLSRPEERESWFRLLERLADSSSQELKRGSIGPTGYLQLYDQPRSYRGKLVTVRGIVHQAYRLNEPQKQWGIDGYYVFTLRPAGGPARPMIVYALGLPEGFPTIDPMSPTGEMTQLFEEVEFTGYFFKRMPYLASDGINRAPLILAREPTWTKPVAVPSRRRLPWLRIALVASAGVVLAIWAFRLATSSLPQRHPRELLPSRIELTQVPASGEQDRSGGGPDARGSTDPSASGPDSGRTRDGRPNTNGAGGAS